MTTGLSWVSTAARTGDILADLPLLDLPKVRQVIGRYDAATAKMPLVDAPDDWDRATLPLGVNLILLEDNPQDPAHGIPIWGGMVTYRAPNQGDTVPLTLSTIESYLDRRYIGDKTYVQVGQNDIIADLISSYVTVGSNGGIPLRVQYVTAGSGKLRDRTYKDSDDKTVYSAMQDLMGVIGGVEWTTGWERLGGSERITPVLYIGDRIGTGVVAGSAPATTFDLPGPVSSISRPLDYSRGKGANDVMATSSGEGTLRPQSPRQVIADPDRPTVEYRFTPSTSIVDTATLTDYAQRAVQALVKGTSSLSMTASFDDAPRLGVDWFIGDDVGYNIAKLNNEGLPAVPAFPGGLVGVGRAIGWERDLTGTQFVTPILTGSTI